MCNLDLVRLVEQRGFDINTAALALEENIGNKISFISQDVMVGSEIQAADRELLGRLNISLVVNVPGDCRKHPAVGSDHISCNFFEGQQLSGGNTIRYIEANVADDGSTPLPLTELVRAIEQEVQRGGRVLIHCKEGKSRTGAVGIAWIMFNERKGFEEAFRLYKQRRGVPDGSRFIPTDILLDQLRAWNPRDVG